MDTTEFVIGLFALLIGAVMLPFSHGIRSMLLLALIALSVLTFLGGGMQYLMSFFQ